MGKGLRGIQEGGTTISLRRGEHNALVSAVKQIKFHRGDVLVVHRDLRDIIMATKFEGLKFNVPIIIVDDVDKIQVRNKDIVLAQLKEITNA